MIRVITIMILMLLLTGCTLAPVYSKTKVDFKCVDGKLLANTYSYLGYNEKEDVYKHLTRPNELVIEKGIKIWCENIEVADGK